MPVIDGDLFSPRIRLSRCDVRTIKQLKSLFRNKKGIENEVTYVIHKYSSALNNYTVQAANKKRRWSECADAQTDLRLCCSHMQLADFLTTWIIIIIHHHRDKTIQFMNI